MSATPLHARQAEQPWFAVMPASQSSHRAAHKVRLYCFPYAGAGHTVFHGWRGALPDHIELAPVRLPGRGARIAEPHGTSIEALADALAHAIALAIDEAPHFALFGHSMGALLAFETARRLQTLHRQTPQTLIVSGRGAPSLPSTRPPFSTLPDGEFADVIAAMGGMPAEIRETPEALAFFLPVLRADIALCEAWRYRPAASLSCPIAVLGGADDLHAPPASLAAWRNETHRDCTHHLFAGGHFFLRDHADAMLKTVERCLDPRSAHADVGAPRGSIPLPSIQFNA